MATTLLNLNELAARAQTAGLSHTGFVSRVDMESPALGELHRWLLSQCSSDYMRGYLAGGLRHWSRQWEYPYILGAVARFAIENSGVSQIFDNACGVNATAYLFASSGLELTGTDLNDQASAEGDLPSQAWSHPDIKALQGTMRFQSADSLSLPFADSQFDASYSISSLEHMPDPVQAIKEMVRVTRPGGLIAFTMDVSPLPGSVDGDSNVNLDNFTRIQEELMENCNLFATPKFHVPDDVLSWQSSCRKSSRLRSFIKSLRRRYKGFTADTNFYIFCGSFIKKSS